MNGCLACHLAGSPRTARTNAELSQNVIPPTFAGFYDRIGYVHDHPSASTSGFGYFHDGADPLLTAARGNDLLAAIMTFEGPNNGLTAAESRQDSHAAVGRQVTLSGAPAGNQATRLNELVSLATSDPNVSLVATTTIEGVRRAWHHSGGDRFTSPGTGQSTSRAALQALATPTTPVTWTMVVEGTERQIALGLDAGVGGNQPPRLTLPTALQGAVGRAVREQIVASDPEGDAITLTAIGLPPGVSMTADGLLTGTPGAAGTFTVSVRATDSRGAVVTDSFSWRVDAAEGPVDANDGPVAQLVSPAPGSTLSGPTVTLTWSGKGARLYWVSMGTAPGRWDLHNASAGTANSAQVVRLPTDGRTLYVRLWSWTGAQWQWRDYTLRAAP